MTEPIRKEPDPMPWLLFSVAMGCFLGLLPGVFRLGRTEGEDFSIAALWLVPALAAGLLLPLLGSLADGFGNAGKIAILGAVSMMLAIDIQFYAGFRIPEYLLLPWLSICLSVAVALHQSQAVVYPEMARAGYVGAGFCTVCLLSACFLWLPPGDGVASDLFSFLFLLGMGLAILCLIYYYLGLPKASAREARVVDGGPSATPDSGPAGQFRPGLLSANLEFFSGKADRWRPCRRFLLFFFLLTLGVSLVIATLLGKHAEGLLWPSGRATALVFLAAGAWSGVTSKGFFRRFGARRTLALVLLALFFIGWGWSVSDHTAENTVLCLLAAFFCGTAYCASVTGFSLCCPANREGQCFGYFFLVMVLGILGGYWLQARLPADAVQPVQMGLCLLGLLLVQGLPSIPTRPISGPSGGGSVSSPWDSRGFQPIDRGLAKPGLISRTIQILARSLAEIFFGTIRVVGQHHLHRQGGTILVANHPNTFLDPLLITAIAPGKLHYWAKSSLWKLPILGSVLDQLGAIPVYRKQDFRERNRPDNAKSFDLATKKLLKGAHVLIFPEGVSEAGLSLKPIKTGAARLALQTVAASEWREDIHIVPIGLDYAEPSLFRTDITIRIGSPVWILKYREDFERDPRHAVVRVTEDVSDRLKDLLPHLEDRELEQLVHLIHDLYGERLLQILQEEDETSARKAISEAVGHYHRLDADTVYLFRQRIEAYHAERERLSTPENHPPIPLKDLLGILAGLFSFASYGLTINWLPYRITGRVVEWLTVPRVWRATAKLAVGIVTFMAYYLALGFLVYHLLGSLASGFVVLSGVLSGFFALGSLDRFAFRFRQLKTLWQAFWTQDTNDDLEAMKLSLIQDLERFRESYAFFREKEGEL